MHDLYHHHWRRRLGALLLGAKALGGPSPRKALKRRMELLKERHADGVAAANAQAQIRKLMAARNSRVEGISSTLIPKPALMRKRLEQTGKQIIARQICHGLGRAGAVRRPADDQGRALPARLLRRPVRRRRHAAFRDRHPDQAAVNKFNSNFPDAIELMVRGLRSGLPITETLGIVAGEIGGPVGHRVPRRPTR